MRKQHTLCLTAASLVLLAAPRAQSQSAFFQAVTNLNPAAYWPLQETAQPPAANVETNLGSLGPLGDAYYSAVGTGSDNYGVRKGAPGVLAAEPGDTSVNFPNFTGAFLAVPLTDPRVSLPGPAFTVEAWIYPTNYNGSGILSQTGPYGSGGLDGGNLPAGTNSAGWTLTQDYIPSLNSGNLQGWSFHVFNGVGAAGGAEAVAGPGFALNQWYHLAAVFDGTNATLYVNGVNASASGYQIPMTGAYVRDTWDPLFIGDNRGFNNNKFSGSIDEVAIYTNALTPAQISNHYQTALNATPATPYEQVVANDGAFLYWRMDAPAYTAPAQTSFPPAANYGSLGNNLSNVPNGVAVYGPGTVPGLAGPQFAGLLDPQNGNQSYAVAFNGIGFNADHVTTSVADYVDCGFNPLLNPTGLPTNGLTVIAWVKGNPMDANGRWMDAVGHSDNSWRLHFNNGQPNWSHGGNTDISLAATTINLNDGNWHMFAGTYDGPGGAVTNESLVVDGAVVTSRVNETLTVNGSPLDFLIGCAPDNTSSGGGNTYNQRNFAGRVAHVAIFTNALTLAQIQSLYSTAVPSAAPAIVTQPASGVATNIGATSKTFQVWATGTAPLTYQWYLTNSAGLLSLANDSMHISGATSNLLTLTNLADNESGYYFVVVTNTFGSATSILSGLKVFQEPAIIAQSPAASFSLYSNQVMTLSVTATGEAPLNYQWYTNGVADGTGTSASYATANAAGFMAGLSFQCVVTNPYGAATNTAVSLLSVLPLPGNSYAKMILGQTGALPAPVGYWPMHESGQALPPADMETNYGSLGSQANGYFGDWQVGPLSGNNPGNGTPLNKAVIHQVTGALLGDSDTAAAFSRQSGGYLVVPHTSPLSTLNAPFTLETWVEPYDVSYGIVLGVGGGNANGNGTGLNGSSSLGGFDLNWSGSANTFSLTVRNGNGSASAEPKTQPVYSPGAWYHLVVEFDGTNVTFYINGSVAGLQNSSSGSLNPNTGAYFNPDSWSPLCVGGGRWSGSINRQFNGAIDEVAIYTNLLAPDRISAHYTAGTTGSPIYKNAVQADNPIIYLRMDSPAWTTPPVSTWAVLTNYGLAGINGVYRPNSVPGGAAGPSESGVPLNGLAGNTALAGDGNSVFADAGYSPSYNPATGNSPISVAAWFKGNPADISQRNWQTLVGHTDQGWRCAINGGTGKVGFDSGNGLDVASALVYNDGHWHQVVGTYDGSNTTVYVDGQFSATGFKTNANSIQTAFGVYLAADPNNGHTNAAGGRELAGSLCEAAVWTNVWLTSNQVVALYSAAGVAPFITAQPISSGANQNAAFTNTVAVGGSLPLSYRWYRDNQPLPIGGQANLPNGATNATLIINPIRLADQSTNYYVVITNNYGAVTSVVWALNPVQSAPLFTNEPVLVALTNTLNLFAGAHPTFNAAAIGAQPVAYQWFTNNVAATGNAGTNTSYSLPSLQLNGVTNVYCVASNFVGKTTCTPITINALYDSASPYPAMVLAANPLGYWRLNEPAQGAGAAGVIANDYWGGDNGIYTNTVLGNSGYSQNTDPSTTSPEFGIYALSDSDVYGINQIDFSAPTNTSRAFTIEAWVNGYSQSKDAAIVAKGYGNGGEEFVLDVHNNVFRFFVRNAAGAAPTASSTISPTYGVWHHLAGVCDEANGLVALYVDGLLAGSAPIVPGTGINALGAARPMTIGSRTSSSATTVNDDQFLGFINDVAVYNYALTPATVLHHFYAAGIAPFITQQPPSSTNVDENGSLTVPVIVLGTPAISYVWSNLTTQAELPNQTNAVLVLSNVPLNMSGDTLQLTAANLYGSVNADPVTLSVISGAPQITLDLPANVVAVAGQTLTLSIGLSGTEPFHYQWYNGSTLIPGPNGPSYSFAAAPGDYSVVVTNIDGTASSSIAAVTTVAPRTDAYASAVQGYGAVGYWPLNETNAPAAADIETNLGTLGAIANAYYVSSSQVTKSQPGALAGDSDGAAEFNGGSGSWLGVPRWNPELTLSNAFSVEAWVNPADENFAAIVSQATPIGANTVGYRGDPNVAGWALYQNGGSAGNFSFHLYNGVTGGGVEPKESTIYNVGGWNHVVATFDGSVVSLYVNGQFQTSQSLSSANPAVYAPNYWSPVEIGASGINHYMFNGSLDEVAIYDYALSPGRIQAHYSAGTNITVGNYSQVISGDAPRLYYRMDSPTYTSPSSGAIPVAVNYGALGAAANGYYLPGTKPGAAGPSILGASKAVAINGLNAAVDIPYNPVLDPVGNTPFSVTAWFKGNPADGAGRWESIVGHSDMSWVFHMNNCLPAFDIGNSGGNADVTIATNLVNANDGNWHFFAGTYDGSTYTIYLDSFANSASSVAGGVPGTNLDILIGGDEQFTGVDSTTGAGFNERYFPGSIAEVAFFTNALTAAQVQNLYVTGTNNIPVVRIAPAGRDSVTVTYTGTLLESTNLFGPWTTNSAPSPCTLPVDGERKFYRSTAP